MSHSDEPAPANEDPPIACSLESPEYARRSDHLRAQLFSGTEERIELADGFAFRFPPTSEWRMRLDEFVEIERHRCSFFRIAVTFEPSPGPIWLRLTGPEGAKAFVAETF